jgi:glycosyltransferase involved in cell wall biosynthesis
VVTSRTTPSGYGNDPAHLAALLSARVPVHVVDSSLPPGVQGGAAFDVIHAHAAVPTGIALGTAPGGTLRPPLVHSMQSWGLGKTLAGKRQDVAAMRRADRIVVPSEYSKALLVSLGLSASSMRVVAYGVDPLPHTPGQHDRLLAQMREWRQRGGEVLCSVGTAGVRMNQRALIEAVARLVGRESLMCVLVGDGETESLDAQARSLGLGERVHVCGRQPDARAVAAAADYFIRPSLVDGPPFSILEAWADGVPVLCSRTPELVELTAGGEAAVLFSPSDPDDIARAITTVRRSSPVGRRGLVERARARYRECFTIDAMAGGYMAEYVSLLARARAAA